MADMPDFSFPTLVDEIGNSFGNLRSIPVPRQPWTAAAYFTSLGSAAVENYNGVLDSDTPPKAGGHLARLYNQVVWISAGLDESGVDLSGFADFASLSADLDSLRQRIYGPMDEALGKMTADAAKNLDEALADESDDGNPNRRALSEAQASARGVMAHFAGFDDAGKEGAAGAGFNELSALVDQAEEILNPPKQGKAA